MGRVPVLQQRNADLIYIKRILENACGRLGIPSPWDGQDLNRQQLNTMIGEHLLPQPQENEFAAHPHTGSKEFGVPFLQMILQIQKISGVSLDKMPYLLALTHVMWTGADPHMADIPMPTTIAKFLHLSTSLDDFKWLEEAVSLSSAFSLMDDESKRLNRANSLLMMTAICNAGSSMNTLLSLQQVQNWWTLPTWCPLVQWTPVVRSCRGCGGHTNRQACVWH